jgi:MYXO-CTERM domain-containing protein
MRFSYDCAGDELIDYWIDPSTMNTDDTRVWVVVDLAANETLLVRMFHGNPAAAAASDLDNVFDGPYSATQQISGGTNGGAGNSQRGIRFTPQRDVLVTEVGKNEPTGTQRYIGLWDFVGGALLHQQQVAGAASVYAYASVGDPIWLESGTQYVLTIFQGATDGYFYQPSSQISPHLTYGDMRYCNACTQNTFPTDALTAYHYGYPDLNYYIKQEVSPPPTATPAAGCPEDATCDADCSVAECGDAQVNASAGEECDDGGVVDGDGCSSACLDEGGAETSASGGTIGTSSATSSEVTGTDPTAAEATGPGEGEGPSDGGPNGDGGSGSDAGDATATSGSSPTAGLPFDPSGGLGRTGCGCRSTPATPAFALVLLLCARRRRHE